MELNKSILPSRMLIKILFFVIVFLSIFAVNSNAAEKFGDFYELNNNIITRILPETSLLDFKNNMENDNIIVINQQGNMINNTDYVGTGMVAQIDGNVYILSVVADLDGNGRVTVTDLLMHATYLSNLTQLDTKCLLSADINNNGKVTLTDLAQIKLATVKIKDIIAPESYKPVAIGKNNSIKIEGSTVDNGVGIKEYSFKLDDGNWVQNADKTNSTYTFSNVDIKKEHKIMVMVSDNVENKKKNKAEIQIEQEDGIYVRLYTDGTLVFTSSDRLIPGKTLKVNYGNIIDKNFGEHTEPWVSEVVKTVDFADVIHPKTTANWFALCHDLTKIDNIENLDTSNVTNMSHMFCQCVGLQYLDLQSFDTSKVTNMEYMFNSCTNMKFINLINFDTRNVTNMYRMFYYCKSLMSVNVTGFDTSKVTNMERMFGYCETLTMLILNFDTSRVTNMAYMFYNCKNMEKIYVKSGWKVPNNSTGMFTGCGVQKVTVQ